MSGGQSHERTCRRKLVPCQILRGSLGCSERRKDCANAAHRSAAHGRQLIRICGDQGHAVS